MAGVTLEDLVKEVGVAPETLDKRCSDDHLRSISLFLDWQTVAPHLGLSESDQEEIESDGKKDSGTERLGTLVKWKAKFAFQATYRRLIEVLLTTGRADHAEEVCKLLKGFLTTGATVTTHHSLHQKTDREIKVPHSTTLEASQVTGSFPKNMEDDIHGLEEEFDCLADQAADDIKQSIKGGKIKLSRVKSTITRLPVSLRHHPIIKFLEEKLSAVNEAETIHALFSILDLYWDFMNCGLLERLIARFGSRQTQQRLGRYLKRLKDFRLRTTVREFTGKWTCKIPSNSSEFKMEMGKEWLEYSLEAVEEFRIEYSRLCSFEKYALHLTKSSHQSVILCWALQCSFPISAEILQPARQYLQGRGVLRVFFKGVCLLDLQPPQAVSSMEGVATGGDMPTHQGELEYESQSSMEPEHIASEADQTASHVAAEPEQVSSEKEERVDVAGTGIPESRTAGKTAIKQDVIIFPKAYSKV